MLKYKKDVFRYEAKVGVSWHKMTTSKFTIILFAFVFLLAAKEVTRAQNAVCRITVFSINSSIPHEASFSETTLLKEFNLKLGDQFVSEHLQHKESGILVFVNATILESKLFRKKPKVIKLAVELFKRPQDSYNFYGGQAEAIYDKNWKGSSVSSHLKTDDYKGYTFTFACEKSEKRADK